ncbi:hypothetical protein ACQ856_08080 [Mycolicibacterium psychrotolerans]
MCKPRAGRQRGADTQAQGPYAQPAVRLPAPAAARPRFGPSMVFLAVSPA